MNKYLFGLVLGVVACAANAQGFQDEPTCFSWNGGHKSAGSFSKCSPTIIAKAPAAPSPPVVVPAPVLQKSNVCPPQIILEPEPKKHVKRKPRPAPKCVP